MKECGRDVSSRGINVYPFNSDHLYCTCFHRSLDERRLKSLCHPSLDSSFTGTAKVSQFSPHVWWLNIRVPSRMYIKSIKLRLLRRSISNEKGKMSPLFTFQSLRCTERVPIHRTLTPYIYTETEGSGPEKRNENTHRLLGPHFFHGTDPLLPSLF